MATQSKSRSRRAVSGNGKKPPGRTPRRPSSSDNGRPTGSVKVQAELAREELRRIRFLRERAQFMQALNEHDNEEPYAPWDDGGPNVSYGTYIAGLDAREGRTVQITSPAALALAEKQLAAEAESESSA